MHRIDFKAVVLAFAAEFALDTLISHILILIFGGDQLVPDMSQEDLQKVFDAIVANGNYQLTAFICGMSTTILGGYLAARLAKGFPYYNGLAIGVVGFVYSLFIVGQAPLLITILSLLLTIPASIYGAHLASKRAPKAE